MPYCSLPATCCTTAPHPPACTCTPASFPLSSLHHLHHLSTLGLIPLATTTTYYPHLSARPTYLHLHSPTHATYHLHCFLCCVPFPILLHLSCLPVLLHERLHLCRASSRLRSRTLLDIRHSSVLYALWTASRKRAPFARRWVRAWRSAAT